MATYRELQEYAKKLIEKSGIEINIHVKKTDLIDEIERLERFLAGNDADPEPEVLDDGTEYLVEYWDMSERPWRVVYRGTDRAKAEAKYAGFKRSYPHTRKNF